VLATVAATVAALTMTLTTQNVRVGMPPDHVHHDINQAAAHSSVLFTQEMGLRHARRFAPRGWGTAHFAGIRRGDCATYWDRREWRLVKAWPVPVTWATFRAGHRWALVTVLRGHGTTVAAVCVHMVTRARSRPMAYGNGTERLAALVDRLRARHRHVVIGGDWNLPYRYGPRHRYPWPVMPRHGMSSMRPPRPTGSNGHGGRIDYVWTARGMRQVGSHIIGNTYSDHQGNRIKVRVR
jgi:endonuclease/exonuclease/phosphatase family metal-dependent hydrolase